MFLITHKDLLKLPADILHAIHRLPENTRRLCVFVSMACITLLIFDALVTTVSHNLDGVTTHGFAILSSGSTGVIRDTVIQPGEKSLPEDVKALSPAQGVIESLKEFKKSVMEFENNAGGNTIATALREKASRLNSFLIHSRDASSLPDYTEEKFSSYGTVNYFLDITHQWFYRIGQIAENTLQKPFIARLFEYAHIQ